MKEFKTKIGSSFYADIYISGKPWDVRKICTEYVKRGACLSLFPCDFIHTDGDEDGFMIRLINYPRFPEKSDDIERSAIELAKELIEACKQLSASVVCHPSGNTTYIYDDRKG